MAWFIGQSAVMIVLAFLLGLLVGWLIWHQRLHSGSEITDGAAPARTQVAKLDQTKAPRRPAKVDAVAVVPTPMHAEPAPDPIDDLARVEGIGAKIAGALVDAGIHTYGQLADTDVDTLRAAINSAGIKFAPSVTTWPQQARLLADGDEPAFRALTDRLVAGRDVRTPAAELPPTDELARIEGIGTKIATALVDAGIRTYGQLADSDGDGLRAAINKAGITFAPSITTWRQQARLLADGDEPAFRALTDRLVAGRDVSDEGHA